MCSSVSLSEFGVSVPGGDSTHVVDLPGESDVSLISPSTSPGVLDLPEFGGVSSNSHGVVGGPSTVLDGENSAPVVVESSLDLKGHGNGSLAQTAGESRVSTGLGGTGELDSSEAVGLAGALARSRSGGVRVVREKSESLLREDLVVSIPIPSSIAAIPSGIGTVDELLLRELL